MKKHSDEVIIKMGNEFYYAEVLHRSIPDNRDGGVLKHCCYINGWGEEWILPKDVFPKTKANVAVMSEILKAKLDYETMFRGLSRKIKGPKNK